MSRRIQIGLIALVVVLVVVGFGGGFDLSFSGTTDEDRSTSSSTTSGNSPTYSDDHFQDELDEANVSVGGRNASFEANKRRAIASGSLTYVTEAQSIAGMHREAKRIAAAYAQAVADGYARTTLYVDVLDSDGDKVGSYAIRREWAVAYTQETLSARAYNQRVIQTGTFLDPLEPTATTARASGTTTAAPVTRETPNTATIVTPTPTRASSEGYTDTEFQRALEAAGIDVDSLQPEQQVQAAGNAGEPLIVEYTTTRTNASARREEVGIVANQYARAVADGYQRTSVSATIYRPDGRPMAKFRIERSWTLAYVEGEISAEGYGQRIGETYRSFAASESTAEQTPSATPPPTEFSETTTVTTEANETPGDSTETEFETNTAAEAAIKTDTETNRQVLFAPRSGAEPLNKYLPVLRSRHYWVTSPATHPEPHSPFR